MKIAIVANDEIQAEILKTIFTSEAYEVTIFSHGMACLKQLESCSFDFFVIDWTLPDIRGSEILRHVRENLGWTVPVVLCNISKEEISAYSGEAGQRFHAKLDRHSRASWTVGA